MSSRNKYEIQNTASESFSQLFEQRIKNILKYSLYIKKDGGHSSVLVEK